MKRTHTAIRIAFGSLVVALALGAPRAPAAPPTTFRATFHDNGSLATCAPGAVFCGRGVLTGFGPATTEVHATSIVPAGDCLSVSGTRTITLTDGSGSLAMTFSGTRCPLGRGGHAARVLFGWTIVSGTGAFAGATGSGSGINTTAGARETQVVSMKGTIDLP